MSTPSTPHLGLGLIVDGQAQKHLTVNEALLRLDQEISATIKSRTIAQEPPLPAAHDQYILPSNRQGAVWANYPIGSLVSYFDGYWTVMPVRDGQIIYCLDEALFLVRLSGAWQRLDHHFSELQKLSRLGVQTDASATHPVSFRTPSTLMSSIDPLDGGSGDTRLTLNKSGTTNIASLIFQQGFSGRAEIGLLGDQSFGIKTSNDGTAWTSALSISPEAKIGLGTSAPPDRLTIANGALGIRNLSGGVNDATLFLQQTQGSNTYSAQIGLTAQSRSTLSLYGPKLGGQEICATYGAEIWTFYSAGQARLNITALGHITPSTTNSYSLGQPSLAFANIYSQNPLSVTSDARLKKDIAPLPPHLALDLILKIEPKFYRFIDDAHKKNERLHAGFLAQDVKTALEASRVDFSVWGLEDKHDENSKQWLRLESFIPIMWAALRSLSAQIASLKEKTDEKIG